MYIFLEPDISICRGIIIGNIYNDGIKEIIKGYNPYKDEIMSTLLDGGIKQLHHVAESNGEKIDVNEYYNSCDGCEDCIKVINNFR